MKEFPQDLSSDALDWAVGVCEGMSPEDFDVDERAFVDDEGMPFCPSVLWGHAGPIIEREKITLDTTYFPNTSNVTWVARHPNHLFSYFGETALVAAMKSYVASKFGDGIEVPFDLMKEEE